LHGTVLGALAICSIKRYALIWPSTQNRLGTVAESATVHTTEAIKKCIIEMFTMLEKLIAETMSPPFEKSTYSVIYEVVFTNEISRSLKDHMSVTLSLTSKETGKGDV
jgi:hypothetical protein